MTDTTPEAEEPVEEGSTLIVALHVLMYTTFACGLIALLVVVLITRR